MTDTASILKSLVSLAIIGIIIYVIIAFHTVLGQILDDMEKLGHTVFQAIGGMLEKLTCCTVGCGDATNHTCSASDIKSMKDNPGYNICSNCTPPCKLPSFNKMSCTEFWLLAGGILGLVGLFKLLIAKIKRDNTKKTIDDADLSEIEASDADVLDMVDIGEKDNILDDADFKDFNIDKSNEDAKAEIRNFMKKDPITLKESDIPKSVKTKYNLEGKNLVDRCKTRLTQRAKARKSMVKHAAKKKLQAEKGPSNKTLNDRLQKDLTDIENEWKKDDSKDKSKDSEDDDYNEDVNEDFKEPIE